MSGLITRRRSLILPAAFMGSIAASDMARSQFFSPPMWLPNPSTFNPTSLITGHGGFWRADMGVTQSGSLVTQWNDQSSFANNLVNFTSGFNPIFSSTGFNTSFSGITFSSSTFCGLFNSSASFSSTTLTFFGLGTWGVGANGFPRIFGMIANGAANDFAAPSQAWSAGTDTGNFTWDGSTLGSSTIYLIGEVYDGANQNFWLNGSVIGSPTAFTSTIGSSPNRFQMGASNSPSVASASMTVAFMGITQKAMNSTDWTNLKNWSNGNFGTSF